MQEVTLYSYILNNTDDLSRLECFKNGLYTVMDPSGMEVCENANIKQGDDYGKVYYLDNLLRADKSILTVGRKDESV